jgi:hypothetical protein
MAEQVFRALNPDLPFLASEAAVDIDNILAGGARELGKIRELVELLNTSVNPASEESVPISQLDPGTLTVLGEAVTAAVRNGTFQEVSDLIRETAKIVSSLECDEPETNRMELEKAREFCLALSRAALAYRMSIYEWRPPHPFRG